MNSLLEIHLIIKLERFSLHCRHRLVEAERSPSLLIWDLKP